jgi:transcriptional antiterminator RfaH
MSVEAADSVPQWYVLHTHLKQESRANNNLKLWGIETLYPKLRSRRVNEFTGRSTYITNPLFPRYLFAKFNPSTQLSDISFTRGIHQVVSFGDQPTPVDEDIIGIIRARMDKDGFVKIGGELKEGDKIVIKAGPLRDFQGIFERELKDNERISVLLDTINYQCRMVIRKDLIEKAND